MKIFKGLWLLLLALLLSSQSAFATSFERNSSGFSGTAAETMTVGEVGTVCSDGLVYKADADHSDKFRPSGIVMNSSVATSGKVDLMNNGIMTVSTAVTPGKDVCLSTTAGGYTQTCPAINPEVIGNAITSRRIRINISRVNKSKEFVFAFADNNIDTAQAAVAMNAAGSSTDTSQKMPWAGYITGISVTSNEAITSGSATFDVTIGGTVTGIQAVLNTTNTTSASGTAKVLTIPVTAGSLIGIKYTTTTNYAPTTADWHAVVYISSGGQL